MGYDAGGGIMKWLIDLKKAYNIYKYIRKTRKARKLSEHEDLVKEYRESNALHNAERAEFRNR